jgi:hypothetical protein
VINESPPHAVTLQVMDTEEGEPAEGAITSQVGRVAGWSALAPFVQKSSLKDSRGFGISKTPVAGRA